MMLSNASPGAAGEFKDMAWRFAEGLIEGSVTGVTVGDIRELRGVN